MELREERRSGIDFLEAVTALLRRNRLAHPTAGLFDAGEVQWWWGQRARITDSWEQLVWLDESGLPAAAVIATEFGSGTQLDPLVLPDAPPDRIVHIMDRGLAHVRALGVETVMLEVDPANVVLLSALVGRGFTVEPGGGLVECWMDADARPAVSPLAEGYRLSDRVESTDRPHHMRNPARGHEGTGDRLRQTSLYRPDLDLVVYDRDDAVAAYGLFWFDPETASGVVEPMRTEDEHQQRGLARHVLTSGVARLARAGAERIKIGFQPDNAASRHLYTSAGFVPSRHNDMCSGPTAAVTA